MSVRARRWAVATLFPMALVSGSSAWACVPGGGKSSSPSPPPAAASSFENNRPTAVEPAAPDSPASKVPALLGAGGVALAGLALVLRRRGRPTEAGTGGLTPDAA